ncbi:unnamed protein product [Penicillium salamii]|uniref:Major facilitator superfamily (MFS) profile domain-containing protein n=1 Tax=Penicillium salamii TaxID=1612424 RepID=A0A9W4NW75_9EURO|nr:unnamed protein product [Penicillium salamii]
MTLVPVECQESVHVRQGETDQHVRNHSWDNDQRNPYNWKKSRKYFIVTVGILAVLNSTLSSSLPSNASDAIGAHFSITNELQLVLPVSCYLIGYVIGPLICGPLSEQLGRKPVLSVSFFLYMMFTVCSGLSPTFPALLVFRLLCGANASAPIAVVGGLYADVFRGPRERGRAMAWFMAATNLGPCLGPILAGSLSPISWRLVFWLSLALAGATFPLIILLPETFAPVLLSEDLENPHQSSGKRACSISTSALKPRLPEMPWQELLRPYQMIFYESIVSCTCLYISFVYAIFYLYLQAYPVIFKGPDSIYQLSAVVQGALFLPIGLGALLSLPIFHLWDNYLQRSTVAGKGWTGHEELRRLPLACLGGPLCAISLFWLGWCSHTSVHWIVPALSGVPFGIGFVLIFIAMLNYLTDAYEVYSASAQSIASTCRSIFGTLLPLAAKRMYIAMGVHWASSLLGFVGLLLSLIPFAFIRCGKRLRASSKLCSHLKESREQFND